MGVKKAKSAAFPRLHEMMVDETIAKAKERVRTSRQLIQESKILRETTQQNIKTSRQRRKKK